MHKQPILFWYRLRHHRRRRRVARAFRQLRRQVARHNARPGVTPLPMHYSDAAIFVGYLAMARQERTGESYETAYARCLPEAYASELVAAYDLGVIGAALADEEGAIHEIDR